MNWNLSVGPGYEMAKRNPDMMDSLMQEVQEFYDN